MCIGAQRVTFSKGGREIEERGSKSEKNSVGGEGSVEAGGAGGKTDLGPEHDGMSLNYR